MLSQLTRLRKQKRHKCLFLRKQKRHKEDKQMAISAADVKKLREMSGAGMMDCKKALTETDGNFDEAMEFLKKKGLATAQKKAGRIAAEGIVTTVVSDDNKTATIIEVNSETDFVAKNEVFQEYVKGLANQINNGDYADMAAFLAAKSEIDPSATVDDHHKAMVAKIGENLTIRRFEKVKTDGIVVSYIHAGGKIGVIVDAAGVSASEDVKEAVKNIAMQIAAMNPQYVSRDDISADELTHIREVITDSTLNDVPSLPVPILKPLIEKAVSEKKWSDEDIAIYEEKKDNMKFLFNFLSKEAAATLAQMALENKDEYASNKIFAGTIEGRVSKNLKEICLLDQPYVKAADGKQTVAAYLKTVDANLKIAKFVRFETGEGLEKKNEDFAAEVAAQMNA